MLTLKNITPANLAEIAPEFGSTTDVRRYFGIKKGTLYNLYNSGKVRGKLLRVTGDFKGVRIWDMASIRGYIDSQKDTLLDLAS
jgi:hypothetical protein